MSDAGASAGWYPDPSRVHESRYWDGATWTDQVADRGITTTAPLGVGGIAPPLPQAVVPPAAFGSPRDARAQAKAAKAYAKAQRPWYRKKRWWALGAIVVLIAIASASSGGTNKSANATSAITKPNGVQSVSDNGTHPPQADVRLSACRYDSSTQFATATLTVVNHSSKRSNYLIGVSFENSHGVQLGSNDAGGGDNVDPGQTSIVQAVDALSVPPDRLKCVVKSVDRFES